VAASTAAWPLDLRARAQRLRRIGVFMGFREGNPEGRTHISAFTQRLSELGWTESRNLRVDVRWAAGDVNRMQAIAKGLVDLQPEVIVAHTTSVTAALQRETRTIPIVFANAVDASGFIEGLPHPGGNITGFLSKNRHWPASRLDCSRRSRRRSRGSPCLIPTRLPVVDHTICPRLRQLPGRSKWSRLQRRFVATPRSKWS